MSTKSEQSFNEEFEYEGTVNAGSIKFYTLVGENPVFSEIKTAKKKKVQESGVKNDNNDDKKDDKK